MDVVEGDEVAILKVPHWLAQEWVALSRKATSDKPIEVGVADLATGNINMHSGG